MRWGRGRDTANCFRCQPLSLLDLFPIRDTLPSTGIYQEFRRLATSQRLTFLLLLSFGLLPLTQRSFAQETTPPRAGIGLIASRVNVAEAGGVKVVLLKSWGVTSGWEALKTEWQNYGTIPLLIDDSTYIGSDFTYDDLVNSKADVIVLSNPAGGSQQYSQDEISAVIQYALAGHNVVGTYVVFEFAAADNRGLAQVFGLHSTAHYNKTEIPISNVFKQDNQKTCLLNKLPSPWQSTGYPFTQVPTPGKWSHSALNLAYAAADSDSRLGIVSTYDGGTYAGIYISNFPEYNGGTNDLQLLYNAVTCYHHR